MACSPRPDLRGFLCTGKPRRFANLSMMRSRISRYLNQRRRRAAMGRNGSEKLRARGPIIACSNIGSSFYRWRRNPASMTTPPADTLDLAGSIARLGAALQSYASPKAVGRFIAGRTEYVVWSCPDCSALINYHSIDVNQIAPPPAPYSRRKSGDRRRRMSKKANNCRRRR